ncbi:MAG: hypothetical protein ACI9DK_002365, partial [Vicingaceae bacterium]
MESKQNSQSPIGVILLILSGAEVSFQKISKAQSPIGVILLILSGAEVSFQKNLPSPISTAPARLHRVAIALLLSNNQIINQSPYSRIINSTAVNIIFR